MATGIELNSETILRVFEDKNTAGESALGIPIYEYLSLDYGIPEEQVFSFHIYGWGRGDMGDGDVYEDDFDGELLYGYLEYLSPSRVLNLKLGRQHIFSGIINESIDGISMNSLLGGYFVLSAIGGNTVASIDQSDSRETILGARIALWNLYSSELGVSFTTISDTTERYEEAGIDISLRPLTFFTLNGKSVWNFEINDWKEHSYEAGLSFSYFYLKPFYHSYQYEDYFRGGVRAVEPFRYLKGTEKRLTVFGGDIIWKRNKNFDLGIRYKRYQHDLNSKGGNYYAALINLYESQSTQCGAETGIMDGESVKDRYQLGRLYLFWDTPSPIFKNWFISSDFLYVHYDQEIYGKDQSIFASLGVGKQLVEDKMQLKISGDFSSDPYFDSNVRFMCVFIYNY